MCELNWKEDLEASKFIIENTHLVRGSSYKHYTKIYNNSDLNHKELFTKIKNGTNSYLGVAASTDPMLNATSMGFKNIHVFDINCLNIHYMFLKIASILELEYQEYLDFFYSLDEEKYFAKKYFLKIKNELPYESLHYWQGLYDSYSSTEFYKLFYTGKYEQDDYKINYKVTIPSNNFLSEEKYYELKNKLRQINLRYYILELGNIPSILSGNKFDLIYLSNMHNYIWDNVHGYNYMNKLKEFEELLSDYGVIQGGFIHWYHYEESEKWFDLIIKDFESIGYTKQIINHVPNKTELEDIALIKRKKS